MKHLFHQAEWTFERDQQSIAVGSCDRKAGCLHLQVPEKCILCRLRGSEHAYKLRWLEKTMVVYRFWTVDIRYIAFKSIRVTQS